MKLETGKGKTFDIRVICTSLRSPNKVLIELEDSRAIADIAADFDGLDTVRTYETESVYHTYEGFTQLVGIQRNTEAGTVRLTLEKEVNSDD